MNVSYIKTAVMRITRILEKLISASNRDVLKNLSDRLKRLALGQNKAIEALNKVIKISRIGWVVNENLSILSCLPGRIGVWKMEVTAQLAKSMEIKLLRFDMLKYMERHTVSYLIGTPPGLRWFRSG